jgi:hypothetical protein
MASLGSARQQKFTTMLFGRRGENVREYLGGRMRLVRTQSSRVSFRVYFFLALASVSLFFVGMAWAGVTGSISGVIRDSSGAVVPGVEVSAHNTETGLQWTTSTDSKGFYSFQALPVGTYDVEANKTGFKGYRQSGIVINVNSSIAVDVALQTGAVVERVTVASDAVHVEETSTQMGEVIDSQKITEVPLVARSFTDLLALQPGVVPVASGLSGGTSGTFVSLGFAINLVSGDLNAGNLSVNGMREASNGFLLNGAVVEETAVHGTAAIPNLDSIGEFRIITNNFDPEYGSYAGGQINVITKSGTNRFHGNVFEFLRNTRLNTRNYFALPGSKLAAFQQNQFGGTFGGPILRNKLFFFGDYQGNRKVIGQFGQGGGDIAVPSDAERTGDFSALSSQMTGTVQGPYWAQQLATALGYPVTQNEPYFFTGCTQATCVFPGAVIPSAAFSTPSKNVLQYIPEPNTSINGVPEFQTSSTNLYLRDNKFSVRVDGNTRIGLLSGYYFSDKYVSSAGNPVTPAFTGENTGHVQVANFGVTKTIGSAAVNEARIAYIRNFTVNFSTGGDRGLSVLTGLGFTGIVPVQPAYAGVPGINFNNFSTGNSGAPAPIIQNTYQALDNYSKVMGRHTMKFGGDTRYTWQIWKNLGSNGAYGFNGNETGIDFADYLIGAPNYYQQGQGYPSNGRNFYLGGYGQDSWRVRPNLTLNYGLRYEIATPWWEKHNEIETLVPGLQSQVFPGSPTGWVFPGDPGIPKTLAPIRYDNFAPRIGIAYSPSTDSGFLRKLTGGPGNSSIRASWGKFYTTFEGGTDYNEIGDAPFGFYYGSPVPPEFANPFIDRGTGFNEGQRFPAPPPPFNVSAKNPDNSVNWANEEPIGSSPGFYYKNVNPYAEDYELAIDRQFGRATLMKIAYVGSQAHHLLSAEEANPGSPALCLSVSQASQVAPGTATCGPNGENGVYTTVGGTVINSTRAPFGPAFTSDAYFKTIGISNYNSLQTSLRHVVQGMEFLASYTYSRSMDNASGYGEGINFENPNQKALSSFDVTHNFVISYDYTLPFYRLKSNRLTNGWTVSGVTHFSTGLPVFMLENDDRSLLGTSGSGPIQLPLDTPNYTPGPLNFTNPRSRQPYFNTSLFTQEPLGQLGNAPRFFFHGPGLNNWDINLQKITNITESMNVAFRAEFFNAFNHAQFGLPDGNFTDSTFGLVTSANPGRIIQFGLKFAF